MMSIGVLVSCMPAEAPAAAQPAPGACAPALFPSVSLQLPAGAAPLCLSCVRTPSSRLPRSYPWQPQPACASLTLLTPLLVCAFALSGCTLLASTHALAQNAKHAKERNPAPSRPPRSTGTRTQPRSLLLTPSRHVEVSPSRQTNRPPARAPRCPATPPLACLPPPPPAGAASGWPSRSATRGWSPDWAAPTRAAWSRRRRPRACACRRRLRTPAAAAPSWRAPPCGRRPPLPAGR